MDSTVPSSQQHDPGYHGENAAHNDSHSYLLPAVKRIPAGLNLPQERRKILDLGCGNGSVTAHLTTKGYDIVGVDPSEEGVRRSVIVSVLQSLRANFKNFSLTTVLEETGRWIKEGLSLFAEQWQALQAAKAVEAANPTSG